MKVFRLACEHGHDFEGWFATPQAFDQQSAAGSLTCPTCDSSTVVRMPSAPYVNTGAREPMKPAADAPVANAPAVAAAMAALKAYVKANTVDVGREFPEVARRSHYGEEDARGIRGRVTQEEARALLEEGVEALPLPPGMTPDDGLH